MKVQDLMTRDVRSCNPETNLSAATSMMWETDCGILPIVADTGTVVGVITDRDIAIALGSRNQPASTITVGAVLSGQVFTCSQSEDVREALEKMRERRVRRLPVTNGGGQLQGILSINDVLLRAEKANGKRTGVSYEDVIETFKSICEHQQPVRAEQHRAAP